MQEHNKGNGNAAGIGNADQPPVENDRLINEKGEKYLREVANIEGLPDARDQEEMDEVIRREKEEKR